MKPLALDHVQFGVRDLEHSARALLAWGFKQRFMARNFAHSGDPRFRQEPKSMIYLEGPDAAFELINGVGEELSGHSLPGSLLGSYVPVINGGPPGKDYKLPWASSSGSGRGIELLECLGCPVVRLAQASELQLVRLLLRTSNLRASEQFFTALGFIREAQEEGECTLVFRASMISRSLEVRLVQSQGQENSSKNAPPFVDALGCSLVAFRTRQVDATLAMLKPFAKAHTPPFNYRIEGRVMRTAVVHGPSNEAIELVEWARGKGR